MQRLTLVICGLILSQHLLAGETVDNVTVKEYPTEQVQKLDFELAAGKAMLNGVNSKKVTVTAVHVRGDCQTIYGHNDGELTVSIKNKSIGSNCEYNVTIDLPSQLQTADIQLGSADFLLNNLTTALTVRSGSGNQRLKKFAGSLEIKTGSGDLQAELDVDSAEIKTGSGTVTLDGIVASFDITTGSGDITLAFNKLTKNGQGKITVGSGDISITAPETATVGNSRRFAKNKVDIKDSNGESLHIDITKGSGDLTINDKK